MLSKNEIKYIQNLAHKKGRFENGQFLAEGPKIIGELLTEIPAEIVALYATEAWLKANENTLNGVAATRVEQFELEKISTLQTPQQVLAVVKTRTEKFENFPEGQWLLMADGIQDPGNLGSMLRIADWFGITHLYCTPATVDIYNPKVVQAAMGSLWRVKVHVGPCEQWLQQATVPIYGAMLQGENIFSSIKWPPGLLIIGNEGRGIQPALLPFLTQQLTIPKTGHAESLNAAVATGILVAQLCQKG